MKFENLIRQIEDTHDIFYRQTLSAVNINLTLRNYLIGLHIVEFEQNGEDRAKYGEKLIRKISHRLNTKGMSYRNLNLFRKFFLCYPQIVQLLTAQSFQSLNSIVQSITALLEQTNADHTIIGHSRTHNANKTNISYLSRLIQTCSFTHFVELIKIDDDTQRKFYELLILKTTPSVEELKRQIATLAFERVGLSQNTELAYEQLEQKIKPKTATDIIKSHYLLEFLNINHPGLVEENELETALLNHLNEFILELGNGFCFEARQKRILIGNKYYFIDLVFYHRLLRCHVLIELKVQDFEHTNAGQLNAYINYYKKNIQQKYDSPPVGILLVTDKNNAMVEYATAGMDENLFVSKYLLQLPDKKILEEFIKRELESNPVNPGSDKGGAA